MAVELAEVTFIEDLDVVSRVVGAEAIFFVAVFAVVSVNSLVEDFVESVDVSLSPGSVFWQGSGDSLKIILTSSKTS